MLQVLGNEILKYIECHDTSRLLHVHALRAGDGLTVARALGRVQHRQRPAAQDDENEEIKQQAATAFVLDLYPSYEQRGIAGRFIAEAREKRRSGAGILADEDRWMLESISFSGGINLPRLRWSRKNEQDPKTAAHLAVAFDTFESRIGVDDQLRAARNRPFYAFGLLSFFSREYSSIPSPVWRSLVSDPVVGEKHPSDRTHTDRLVRLQQVLLRCVARSMNCDGKAPLIDNRNLARQAHSLRELHRLCDWVITLDRNAGIEYFDSPRDNKEIYDAYVIDCVPERQDLGCLQLITSTSNLEEVRNLLDSSLDQMGLSRSRRNAEFLLEQLKALSGRLAIRLTGQRAPTSELIALALCHANCWQAQDDTDCWTSLRNGFLISVDDVRDLLPPLMEDLTPDAKQLDPEGFSVAAKATRPDLIYVSVVQRRGLLFRFIEVKYRRHLRLARSPEVLEEIRCQVGSLHDRWCEWYANPEVSSSFRALRRAKLAHVLHFYADKGAPTRG